MSDILTPEQLDDELTAVGEGLKGVEALDKHDRALRALLEQALTAWASYATNSRERADIAKIRKEVGLEPER
jgi:hypothetical protein